MSYDRTIDDYSWAALSAESLIHQWWYVKIMASNSSNDGSCITVWKEAQRWSEIYFLAMYGYYDTLQSPVFVSKHVKCNLDDHINIFMLFSYSGRKWIWNRITVPAKSLTVNHLFHTEFNRGLLTEMTIKNFRFESLSTWLSFSWKECSSTSSHISVFNTDLWKFLEYVCHAMSETFP